MMKIAPSLLAADFSCLAQSVKKVEQGHADMLHLDIMDGRFVPNISFGSGVIAALRPHSKLFFDVHLMIEEPERYLDDFIRAGADGITVHCESTANPISALKKIRDAGLKSAAAISPDTPADRLYPLLPFCDMVLVMTVYPGFGGQTLIPATLAKAAQLRDKIEQCGYAVEIEADGGIGPANLSAVKNAGISVAVAGSAVFGARDPASVIAQMHRI